MYVEPLTIYREYAQNAADAIDAAREHGALGASARGRLDITIDTAGRSILIRDNGAGIRWGDFAARLTNLGASAKRGTPARGFRGVGRLAGLGYCQELIFRSRTEGEAKVSEMRWDCRALKMALRASSPGQPLSALVRELVTVRRDPAERHPQRFFEVELRGVIRHRDDRLLNPAAVGAYLSQVAPVPFAPEFKWGTEITAALRPHVSMGELDIRINGAPEPLYRPHRDHIGDSTAEEAEGTELQQFEVTAVDGGTAAVGWILHHGYSGAIPAQALVKGIRLRAGNIQVGDNALLEELFAEPRFNGWAIGEVHVLDPKILPNGRRDHFEQSVHVDNLLNQLTPLMREISRRCRQSSIARKWVREFELHKEAALDRAKAIARGGISKAARRNFEDGVARALKAMQKVISTRHLGDDTRAELSAQASSTEARVQRLVGAAAQEADPLARFKPQVRGAYEHVLSLIYECTANRAAAASIVDKLLARLAREDNKAHQSSSPPVQKARSKKRTRKAASRRR